MSGRTAWDSLQYRKNRVSLSDGATTRKKYAMFIVGSPAISTGPHSCQDQRRYPASTCPTLHISGYEKKKSLCIVSYFSRVEIFRVPNKEFPDSAQSSYLQLPLPNSCCPELVSVEPVNHGMYTSFEVNPQCSYRNHMICFIYFIFRCDSK